MSNCTEVYFQKLSCYEKLLLYNFYHGINKKTNLEINKESMKIARIITFNLEHVMYYFKTKFQNSENSTNVE